MARQIKLDDREKIEIVDADGNVTGYFRFNPTDTAIIERFENIEKYFKDKQKYLASIQNGNDIDIINELIREIKIEFDKFLNYEGAGETLFKNCSPLAIRPNGEMHAVYVVNALINFIQSELKSRSKKAEANISKYTNKYQKRYHK
nr:MAG TPA: hypothetical protein [Caudoviricetes sp.]